MTIIVVYIGGKSFSKVLSTLKICVTGLGSRGSLAPSPLGTPLSVDECGGSAPSMSWPCDIDGSLGPGA